MLDAKSFVFGILFCLVIGLLSAGALSYFMPAKFGSLAGSAPSVSPASNLVEPLFSPGSSDEIVSLIRSAQKSIDVEMYVFTDPALARELSDASARGVSVRVILESRVTASNLDTIAAALSAGGAQVRWASPSFQLTHAKMMVVDGKRVLVGSINFSKAAQTKNREAAVILQGDAVAAYEDIFEKDWAISLALRQMTATTNETAG